MSITAAGSPMALLRNGSDYISRYATAAKLRTPRRTTGIPRSDDPVTAAAPADPRRRLRLARRAARARTRAFPGSRAVCPRRRAAARPDRRAAPAAPAARAAPGTAGTALLRVRLQHERRRPPARQPRPARRRGRRLRPAAARTLAARVRAADRRQRHRDATARAH